MSWATTQQLPATLRGGRTCRSTGPGPLERRILPAITSIITDVMAHDGYACTDSQAGRSHGADGSKPGGKNVHDNRKPTKVGLTAFAGGESRPNQDLQVHRRPRSCSTAAAASQLTGLRPGAGAHLFDPHVPCQTTNELALLAAMQH
jgi:hypothetical protein